MQGIKNINLAEALEGLEDPRTERVHKYLLAEILFTAFAGILCGARSYVAMANAGELRLEQYRQFLPFDNGIPSGWTLRNVLSRLDPEKMHEVFASWMMSSIEEYLTSDEPHVIALDGKQARRTKDTEKKPLHVVSAFDSSRQLVLGQKACAEKSNEITAIPDLLRILDIKGAIVTIDAIGTQHIIANTIIERGGDYLLTVKKNRKVQFRELEAFFAPLMENVHHPKDGSYAITRDAGHGRFEVRECWVCSDVSSLPQTRKWKGVQGAAVIKCRTERNGKITEEIRYLIFSRAGMSAEKVLTACRKHWGIENGLHWVLDMVFREDESRARHGHSAENLNVLRHMAFDVLRPLKDKGLSFDLLQQRCLLSDGFFSQVIKSIGFMTAV